MQEGSTLEHKVHALWGSTGRDRSAYPRGTREAIAEPASRSAGSTVVPALRYLQLGRLCAKIRRANSEQSTAASRAERRADRQADTPATRQRGREEKEGRRGGIALLGELLRVRCRPYRLLATGGSVVSPESTGLETLKQAEQLAKITFNF